MAPHPTNLRQRNILTVLVLLALTCGVATSIFLWRAHQRTVPQPVLMQGESPDGR